MLQMVRKSRRPLCHGLVILLLSSWVSCVCQSCFANTDVSGIDHSSAVKMPCHQMQNQPDRQKHSSGNQPSGHHCNCHLYIAATAPDSDAMLIAASQGFDHLPPLAYSSDIQSWPMSIITRSLYFEPEQATSPPFARYTVLLN